MSAARKFLDRANMADIDETDPVFFATEAALDAVPGALDPEHAGRRALKHMPASSTKFERGIAFGMAIALASKGPECVT